MVAWCLRRALLSGLTRRWQTGTSIVGSCWIQWFFLKVITLNPVITTPPPFTVVQKKTSTLTKVTIRRFTSMLVAMGGVNCKFVFFGSEPFFFG